MRGPEQRMRPDRLVMPYKEELTKKIEHCKHLEQTWFEWAEFGFIFPLKTPTALRTEDKLDMRLLLTYDKQDYWSCSLIRHKQISLKKKKSEEKQKCLGTHLFFSFFALFILLIVLPRFFFFSSTSQKWLELCLNPCQCIRTYIV